MSGTSQQKPAARQSDILARGTDKFFKLVIYVGPEWWVMNIMNIEYGLFESSESRCSAALGRAVIRD